MSEAEEGDIFDMVGSTGKLDRMYDVRVYDITEEVAEHRSIADMKNLGVVDRAPVEGLAVYVASREVCDSRCTQKHNKGPNVAVVISLMNCVEYKCKYLLVMVIAELATHFAQGRRNSVVVPDTYKYCCPHPRLHVSRSETDTKARLTD